MIARPTRAAISAARPPASKPARRSSLRSRVRRRSDSTRETGCPRPISRSRAVTTSTSCVARRVLQQVLQRLRGGRVTPVGVVEHHVQRRIPCGACQRSADAVQQPVAGALGRHYLTGACTDRHRRVLAELRHEHRRAQAPPPPQARAAKHHRQRVPALRSRAPRARRRPPPPAGIAPAPPPRRRRALRPPQPPRGASYRSPVHPAPAPPGGPGAARSPPAAPRSRGRGRSAAPAA